MSGSLLTFVADLARAQARARVLTGGAPDDLPIDLTERAIHTVLDVTQDFAQARHEAQSAARLEQLRERVQACLQALDEQEEQLTLAIHAWPASRLREGA